MDWFDVDGCVGGEMDWQCASFDANRDVSQQQDLGYPFGRTCSLVVVKLLRWVNA